MDKIANELNLETFLPEILYEDHTGIVWDYQTEIFDSPFTQNGKLCIATTKEGLQIPVLFDKDGHILAETYGIINACNMELKNGYRMTFWNGPTENFLNSYSSKIEKNRLHPSGLTTGISSLINTGLRDLVISAASGQTCITIGTLKCPYEGDRYLETSISIGDPRNNTRLVFLFNKNGHFTDLKREFKYGVAYFGKEDESNLKEAILQVAAEVSASIFGEEIDLDDPEIFKEYCIQYLGIEPKGWILKLNHLKTMRALIENLEQLDNQVNLNLLELISYD